MSQLKCFYWGEFVATTTRQLTSEQKDSMCLAAQVIAERMRGDMETELRKYFRDDKIEVKIEG